MNKEIENKETKNRQTDKNPAEWFFVVKEFIYFSKEITFHLKRNTKLLILNRYILLNVSVGISKHSKNKEKTISNIQ